jgi:hypothetical protein
MDTDPLRSGPPFAPTLTVTLPVPTPELAEVTVIHGDSELAVQVQADPWVFCTDTVSVVPPAGTWADAGLIANAHATAAAA